MLAVPTLTLATAVFYRPAFLRPFHGKRTDDGRSAAECQGKCARLRSFRNRSVTLDLNNDRRRMNVNTARQPVILVILVGLAASLAAGGCTKWLSKPATADPMNVPLDDDLTSTDYVGEIAQSWGLGYAKVEGIGLVNSLAGTGGMPADSWQRDHLVDEMRTHGVPKINEILGSKATSMVLIRGLIPPAAKAG